MSTPNEIQVVKNRESWRRHGWTASPNALLLRSDISWEAKGAFGWLSLAADDPDFEVDANSLAAAGPKGRDHARGLIRELEQHGFLTRSRVPDKSGTPVLIYELFPLPVDVEERTYRPSTAKPKRKAFPQRNPQRLTVQGLGDEQRFVDNSTSGDSPAVDRETEEESVSAAQPPKTDRPGPGRSGPGRSGALTSPSRKTSTSSSLGSSVTADSGVEQAEEEEESLKGEDEDQEQAARRLVATTRPHLASRKKFLLADAREQVIKLLRVRLEEGHREEFLEAQLHRWCREAKNPSFYLPMQLDELGPPRTELRVVRTDAAETPKDQASEVSEETKNWAREVSRQIGSRPRVNRGRNPQSTDQDREPRSAFQDLMGDPEKILNEESKGQKHA